MWDGHEDRVVESFTAESMLDHLQRQAFYGVGTVNDGGSAADMKADSVVLNANPLEDISNTRQIASVYLQGKRLDRDALLANWKKANTTSNNQD